MDKWDKLLSFMKMRMAALQNEIDRDKGGGLADSKFKFDECKFWKEYIERECLGDKTKEVPVSDSVHG